ncbi:hypothetical protein Indivirus_1_147 [Indivirus ILV1]|uniref:Uncharacterized protein n=1 Tax=Indivirus ILV1 TaxID=1977633 RepID=A0A1V0SD12_9VIRU|nr:hypothetical protein Indivirus_1_147 [Indivirus ILV1]
MFIEIVHFAIAAFAGTIYWTNYNFLFKMMTLDSLFNALHFMNRFIDNSLTESQIIAEENSLYIATSFDRYIYYLMIHLLYKTAFYFFWINESFIYYYIGLFTIVPCILNQILQSRLFKIISNKKEHLIKIILAKILTSIIKFCAKVYLNKDDVNVKYTEIMEILNDYRETVSYFFTVLKSLAVIFGLSYVKSCAPSMYYGIIKYIYNYKTGEMITSYNHASAKALVSDIIENKKWNELTKVNTYKAMIYLYQMNTDKVDFFGKFINDFNFTLVKMFSIWTMTSLISNIFVSPVLALCFFLYKRYIRNSTDGVLWGELLMILISCTLGYFNENYFLVSFINQFGPKILFNSISYIILKVLAKNIKEMIEEVIRNNKDTTISFLIINGYIFLLKLINIQSYILIGLNLLANILMGIETKKQILFGIILSTTFPSDFNTFHVIFNSTILYIVFGLFDFINIYTIQDLLRTLLKYTQKKSTLTIEIKDMFEDEKNPTINNLAFEILDTNKYPSISQLGQKINRFDVSSIRDSVTVDDPIFDQSDDMFINEISVNNNDSEYFTKLDGSKIEVINNFF